MRAIKSALMMPIHAIGFCLAIVLIFGIVEAMRAAGMEDE